MKKKKIITLWMIVILGMLAVGVHCFALEKKQDLVMIIASANSETSKKAERMAIEKFGSKYNIIAKGWDERTIAQTVKTAAAADIQLDLVQYWPGYMNTFISAGLALDLTPYMDKEWASRFKENALEIGTYDGKLYNVPYNTVYPLIIVNTDITDAAGIKIPDQWSWEEFVKACRIVKEKTNAYGAGINKNWACWLTRNALLQMWDTNEEVDAWNAGQISFKDKRVIKTMEKVKSVFDEDLFYPGGTAALALSLDQANAAFSQGRYAFMFTVNTIAAKTIENTGIENYKIVDWPFMGKNPKKPLLGGSDGYFIPACAKNVEGAVEVMKYLTSEEVLAVRLRDGQIPPVKITNTDVDPEFLTAISRCINQIYPTEIINLSSELNTYICNEMPANHVFYGKSALDELETMRKAAISK